MDKLICVGKNYLDHAAELGDAVPPLPVLFLKPPSVARFVTSFGDTIEVPLPRDRGAVHFECEIVARLDGEGKIIAVTLGLDMTLRDLQTKVKAESHPWEIAKVFVGSAIVGPWSSKLDGYLDREFSFYLDGKLKQNSSGNQMRLCPQECVDHAANYFPLCDGDILFTGTPAGVGAVEHGQCGEVYWLDTLMFKVEWI